MVAPIAASASPASSRRIVSEPAEDGSKAGPQGRDPQAGLDRVLAVERGDGLERRGLEGIAHVRCQEEAVASRRDVGVRASQRRDDGNHAVRGQRAMQPDERVAGRIDVTVADRHEQCCEPLHGHSPSRGPARRQRVEDLDPGDDVTGRRLPEHAAIAHEGRDRPPEPEDRTDPAVRQVHGLAAAPSDERVDLGRPEVEPDRRAVGGRPGRRTPATDRCGREVRRATERHEEAVGRLDPAAGGQDRTP